MYLLKLAFRPWRLAPIAQSVSSVSVGFTLFVVGTLFWLQEGLAPVIAQLEGEKVITAYLKPGTNAAEEGQLVDSIHSILGSQAISAEVQPVERAQFVEHLKQNFPELGREVEDLGPDAAPIVPQYISIKGVLDDTILTKIQSLSGIESAETSGARHVQSVGAFTALRWVARIIALGLCLTMAVGLVHLVGIHSHLHRDTAAVLALFGAGRWTKKIPVILSGAMIGGLGGLIALLAMTAFGGNLISHIQTASPQLAMIPAPSPSMSFLLFALGVFVGTGSGIFGAWINEARD